jgi:hypothetical protein
MDDDQDALSSAASDTSGSVDDWDDELGDIDDLSDPESDLEDSRMLHRIRTPPRCPLPAGPVLPLYCSAARA